MENTGKVILVAGATGHQGGAVAHQLLQQGKFTVHALVRDKNKPAAKVLEESGAELVEGDFDDPASLDRALQGVYGFFSVQDRKNGLDVEIRQGKAIADAAKKAGVAHFVYTSVGSAERSTGIPHFESKFQVEEHIKEISLPYTIMRPVFFMYNYDGLRPMIEQGTLFMPLSTDKKLQQLSEDEYGKMVSEVFNRPGDFMGKEMEIANVDITMPEVAATLSLVMGKEIKYRQIPFETFQQQAGEERTIMFRWFENVGYSADIPALEKLFFKLTDFEAYLREHGWDKKS